MYCTQCGQNVADGKKFCTNCGSPIREEYIPKYNFFEENDNENEIFLEDINEMKSTPEKNYKTFASNNMDVSQMFVYAITAAPLVLFLISLFRMAGIIYFAYIVCVIIGDYQNLKEITDANMKGWAILGVFLPPVYLFMRAQNTDKDYRYAAISFGLLFLYEILLRII